MRSNRPPSSDPPLLNREERKGDGPTREDPGARVGSGTVVAETVAVLLVIVPAADVTVAVTVEELPIMALPPASSSFTTG